MAEDPDARIDALIEQSSLGAPGARRLRQRTSKEEMQSIVSLAASPTEQDEQDEQDEQRANAPGDVTPDEPAPGNAEEPPSPPLASGFVRKRHRGSRQVPAPGTMQIDYESGEAVYLQIARLLRDQIIQGELQVGSQLPSGNEMQASRGVTRVTYQHAVDQLREAGPVVTRAGKGTFVVAVPMLKVSGLSAGDQVTARMPTDAEREQLDTRLSPVLEVTRADGTEEVFPAAVTVCQARSWPDSPSADSARSLTTNSLDREEAQERSRRAQ